MKSRTLVIALITLVLAVTTFIPLGPHAWAQAPARTQLEFWHAMKAPLGPLLEGIAARFNTSQPRYTVNATFKGEYPDTMVPAIAACAARKSTRLNSSHMSISYAV